MRRIRRHRAQKADVARAAVQPMVEAEIHVFEERVRAVQHHRAAVGAEQRAARVDRVGREPRLHRWRRRVILLDVEARRNGHRNVPGDDRPRDSADGDHVQREQHPDCHGSGTCPERCAERMQSHGAGRGERRQQHVGHVERRHRAYPRDRHCDDGGDRQCHDGERAPVPDGNDEPGGCGAFDRERGDGHDRCRTGRPRKEGGGDDVRAAHQDPVKQRRQVGDIPDPHHALDVVAGLPEQPDGATRCSSSKRRKRHEGDRQRRRTPPCERPGVAYRSNGNGRDDRQQHRRRRMRMHGERHRRRRPHQPAGPAVLRQTDQRVEHEHRARGHHVRMGKSDELEAAPARKRQQRAPQQAEPAIERGGARRRRPAETAARPAPERTARPKARTGGRTAATRARRTRAARGGTSSRTSGRAAGTRRIAGSPTPAPRRASCRSRRRPQCRSRSSPP